MNKRKSFQNGITLIALVISIIVMLILAGVSLNATIGDNGIITQAQNATYMQSIAALEEYLNDFYVKHYEEFNGAENKAAALKNYSESSAWFYQGAPLGYVIDSDGNSHYFINVNNLPEEIKKGVKGGSCNGKKSEDISYQDYLSMQDVYGVTNDLKVYYCNNGKNSILGISENELDTVNENKEILSAGSSLAKLITGNDNEAVTLAKIKSVKKLTIDNTSQMNSLKDLYNLVSLEELILKDINLDNLSGIENTSQLNHVEFNNVSVGNYNSLGNVNKLKYLYFINTNNDEINKLVDGIKDVDYGSLRYFGIYQSSQITNIDCIKNLTNTTKSGITNLYLNNNNVTDLSCLTDFSGVLELRVNNNTELPTLKGIENMKKLNKLSANNCNLGKNEIYDVTKLNNGKNSQEDALSFINTDSLSYIELSYNTNLKWIEYLKDKPFSYMYLVGCGSMVTDSVKEIKDTFLKVSVSTRNIDSKYNVLFNTTSRLNYDSSNLSNKSTEFENLYNNKDIKALNLSNNTNLKETGLDVTEKSLSETLATCTNLEVLYLKNITSLTNLDFVKNLTKLKELDLRGCSNLNDLSALDTYNIPLVTLRINNKNIDLTKIQKTISRLEEFNSDLTFESATWFESGLYIDNLELLKKLSDCTEITALTIHGRLYYGYYKLDLSKCEKLKTIKSYYAQICFKIPKNVIYMNLGHDSSATASDLTGATNLISIDLPFESNISRMNDWNKQLANCSNLESINISRVSGNANCTNFDLLKNCTKLKTIKIATEDSNYICTGNLSGFGQIKSLETLEIYRMNFKNMTDFSSLSNLKRLACTNAGISDISELSNLENLETLNLSDNSISNVEALKNLNKLNSLNLSNNCIYDISTDSNGNSFNNLEILANLNQKGKLRTLFLSGNSGITDWTILSKIKNWESKSGF